MTLENITTLDIIALFIVVICIIYLIIMVRSLYKAHKKQGVNPNEK